MGILRFGDVRNKANEGKSLGARNQDSFSEALNVLPHAGMAALLIALTEGPSCRNTRNDRKTRLRGDANGG